ncbi:MAG: mandelate racemase/muconate lactonizing enzyme family protein [Nocardioidaceae bacterium]
MTDPTLATGLRDTVAAVETTTVRLALDDRLAVHGARHVHAVSEFVLVRVRTSSGGYGYGEVSATRNWSGEDAVTAGHFVRDVVGPALVGERLAPVPRLSAMVDRLVAGNPFMKAGVNTALWDALGRLVGLPVAVLLGGPYRTEVPVKMSLSGDGDRLVRCHQAASAKGFTAFKVKVGKGVVQDLERARLARATVGEDAFLGADANGGWASGDARRAVAALRDLGFDMVEQPCAADDLAAHGRLRALGLPVVLDESVYGAADLVRAIRAEAADGVSLYVGKSAGLEHLVHAATIAGQAGLEVIIGSNAEMGIGSAAMIHAAAACPTLGAVPSDIIGHHFYTEDILATPLDIDGRRAALPDGPGLGVELRDDVVKAFR